MNAACRFILRFRVLLLVAVMPVQAQLSDGYQRLQAVGPIPEDFLLSTLDKTRRNLGDAAPGRNRKEQALQSQFYASSSYYLNQLLRSGKVLFNDPVSEYLRELVHYLLREDPDTRDRLRVYAVRSATPNAFATHDGILLVNLALLARLESEAQLAFILCHEISHFRQKHALDVYRYSQPSGRRGSETSDGLAQAMASAHYNREKEQEADSLGLELFLGSDYAIDAAISVFEVLKYAHLPAYTRPFDRQFLETPELRFPQHFFKEKTSPRKAIEENGQLLNNTHPDPVQRQLRIAARVKSEASGMRAASVFGNEQFEQIRERCRYETVQQLLVQRNCEAAIYESYCLQQSHPGDYFLKKITVQALYTLARYASEGKLWNIHMDYEELSGPVQQLHYWVEQMEAEDLAITALLQAWQLQADSSGADPELQMMAGELAVQVVLNGLDNLDDLFLQDTDPAGYAAASNTPAASFARIALAKVLKTNPARLEQMREIIEGLRSGAKDNEEAETPAVKPADIRDVVLVEPFYRRIDRRKAEGVLYMDSELAQERLGIQLQEYARRLKLNPRMLSNAALSPENAAEFCDLALLNEWFRAQHHRDALYLVNPFHNEAQYLAAKYGTPYFMWPGVVATASRPKGRLLRILAGIVFPFSLPEALGPNYDTYVFLHTYNLRAGEALPDQPRHLRLRDRPDILNATIFDLLYQFKHIGQ